MRKLRIFIAVTCLATPLAGCGLPETFGVEDYLPKKKETYNLPVLNAASRAEPFPRPLGYADPTHSWSREGASESEPWTHP